MWSPELKKISQIQFGILSPEEIRKLAVARILTPDTYNEDGSPVESGLMDRRLGTIEPGMRCRHCGNTVGDCAGHFGIIELARPVIHVGYAKSIIYKLLKSTCRVCSRILLEDVTAQRYRDKLREAQKQGEGILQKLQKEIAKEARKKSKCPHCQSEQYKVKYEKPTTFHEETVQGPVKLTPTDIQERFERIPALDLALLGIDTSFSRPEWMILTGLPVPPVSVRASITLESGIKSEDDLTHKLVDIIRINKRLRENIEAGAPQLIVEDLWELLQYHVTTYMDNEVAGIPPARHRSGRALRTLTQRLRGKEGRFRGNLSGKRVDFSARTVISPDPNISINEVGVPEQIAKILTVPERVTEFNVEEMKELVMNGPADHPGSNYIIRADKKRIDLRFVSDLNRTAESLDTGFIVERHLKDGDIVLFNRQPSLHRMSIMAHEVRVMPGKTFRLHLCVCTPYNADFDGDEMNLHVPQSEEARSETRVLMRVQEQILSPRYGGPIIGAIHDYITAAYLLTWKKTFFAREEAWQLLLAGNYEEALPDPAIEYPKELWTGKQLFSLLLPSDVNITARTRTSRGDPTTSTEFDSDDAVVIRDGELLSGTIDRKAIGADESESVLHVVVKDHGSDRARDFIDFLTQMLLKYLSHLGFSLGLNNINLSDEIKLSVSKTIEKAEKEVEDIIQSYRQGQLQPLPGKTPRETLEMKIMGVLSKARDRSGEIARANLGRDNTVVIMATTGARGTPLSITQMSAAVGQQSIRGERILRGYHDRSLPHFKKGDYTAAARGFVRSNFREGLNPLEFFFHAQGGREGLVDTAVRTSTSGYLQRRLVNAMQDLQVNYDHTVRTSDGEIVQLKYGEDGVDPMKSYHGRPVDIQSLLQEVLAYTDEEITEPIPDKLIVDRIFSYSDDELPDKVKNDLYLEIKNQKDVSITDLDRICEGAYEAYQRSLAEPGEAIGTIASQSIGEPGTQMTLKTFHFAGVAELNVTIGLPRLIEILDARKNPASPFMKIFLEDDMKKDNEKAKKILRKIELTTIKNVSQAITVEMGGLGIEIQLDPKLLKDKELDINVVEERLGKLRRGKVIRIDDLNIRFEPENTSFDEIYKIEEKISTTQLSGIKEITKVIMVREKVDMEDEWVLYAEGSNLSAVLTIPGVNPTKVTTNNIEEILETLGVEAARQAVINEAQSVLKDQGLEVDIRHLLLVADMMCQNGIIRQIGRHGISGEKESVLAKAGFEVTVRHLLESAAYGKLDHLRGITENVIIGQIIPVGTGTVELIMFPGIWTDSTEPEALEKEYFSDEEKPDEEKEIKNS
ncbi:MAG: DNA-directed RNA polymerase subunit A' [Candidatus Hodarchaeales archaeon]|jgi:DNA-directed RNA polymerase subunit A'